ncbi:serine protease [Paenibacillus sp. CAA11]|uniref:S8 family serine peptidase n=1 Tax=Paenibacillus sp. CAA11 TaxID=1532905 RepID=UPI000D37FFA5|nr:S8 family serine peptidase [Paenibacillus sp. CAA11]AWB43043.1 serine protease [Paenibacillus sp. CAA11]
MIGKGFRKHLSLGLALVLTLTLAPTSYAEKPSISLKSGLSTSSALPAKEKISQKLQKLFEGDEYVTYLVKMKEQTDTVSVAKNALQKATLNKATPSAAKMSARTSVVSALRETAARSQSQVEKLLEQEQKKGQVKEFKSYFIVNAFAVTSTKDVMESLSQLSEVEKILPDEVRHLDKAEIDKSAAGSSKATTAPAVQDTKNHSSAKDSSPTKDAASKDSTPTKDAASKPAANSDQIEWNIAQINAPEVWAKGIDGTGIVVANLDTGVDYTHPALARKWRGLDASGNVVNPELSWYDPHSRASLPQDGDGHGTHTMGTMVGSEENGSNQIGVAPGAKWIAVRIFNPETTDSIILDGGQWLLAPVDRNGNLHPELAPDVVNNSWGGGAGMDEWFRPMVQAWRAAQIFPEFSAGNTTLTNPGGPGSVANPANYPESFATGATDINQNLGSFSLLGPSPYGETKPEVSAPGVNIRSSVPGGNYEGGWNGTSMAGPHTTALAALLLQANHSLTVDQLEEIIQNTATPRTDSQFPTSPNNGYGHGIINALDAVGSILQGVGSVSGKVTTAGEDEADPVLEHTAPTLLYSGVDAKITARITDNVSVTSAEVFARTAGSGHYVYLPLERVSGTSTDGQYETTIPASLIKSAGLEYYFRINDYGNNSLESKVYSVQVSDGVKPEYFQDFETDNAGFTTGGTGSAWTWGTPVSGPGAAYSGNKLIATNLTGTYAANSNAYIALPTINLKDSPEGAFLSFKHWYDLENNVDRGTLYLATEGNSQELVPLASFTGASGGWKKQYVDLRPYAGQQIHLLFNITSDASVQKAGWYIDDIAVTNPDAEAPAAPASLTATTTSLGQVNLTWNASEAEDLKQYKVYRSTTSGSGYEEIAVTPGTSYTDVNVEDNTTYYYTVTAQDYSDNESERSTEASVTVQLPEVLFSDNFDRDSDGGWTHSGTGDEWERGVPSAPGPAAAVSEPNVWGTDLDSTYENGTDASLVSPVIDLSAQSHAALSFSHWYEIETKYDAGTVEITTNGGSTWTELGRFSHSTEGKQWQTAIYDLDAYTGHEVQLRFHLKADNSVVKAGWYIDNVSVLSVAAPEGAKKPAPTKELDRYKAKPEYDSPLFKITSTTDSAALAARQAASQAVQAGDSISAKDGKGVISPASLPASATVTVVETGRSVKTDGATGRYNFTHVAGDYTLKAEAYGYYPQTQPVKIANGSTAKVNFSLKPIPHGIIEGTIVDERSGEPVAGAQVFVLEDPRVAAVQTAADGTFTLDVQEGSYTLVVSADEYYGKDVPVTVAPNESTPVQIELKPFIGFPGEISYDDGTPENARSFNAAGNSWAVRFTPDQAEATQVTGASFRFWNTEWPVPGGTAFKYSVYDASGANGAPGRLLAGPYDGTALRNNEWTVVTLEKPVTVQGDFYIVYTQTAAGTAAPGLATDESSPNALRSWQQVSGAWSQSPEDEGNYMIRAVVRYPVNAPVITSPEANSFTKESTVTVTGTLPVEGAEVKIYNGTAIAGTGEVKDGKFSLQVELANGVNELTAEAVVNGKITDRSLPVTVTLDQTLPELTITSPVDGARINSEALTVTGTVTDEFLDTVTLNGEAVTVGDDHAFTHRLLVNPGENTITVIAKDRAGNETTVTRTVHVDLALPEITNIKPESDVNLKEGETLRVSFDSAPGLTASFHVELPLSLDSARGIPLTETEPGHYEAEYTIPAKLVVDGGLIVIKIRDAAGNETQVEAPGKLYVGSEGSGGEDNLAPVAVISAPDQAKKKKNVEFSAEDSYDEDGEIVSYAWDFGDGKQDDGDSVRHKFKESGTYVVTLTVTDDKGAVSTAEHTIEIK